MGVYIKYNIDKLIIKSEYIKKVLENINNLHNKNNLKKLANGKTIPLPNNINTNIKARKYLWYSWVTNPEHYYGFESIEEAFKNWRILDNYIKLGYTKNNEFIISGNYDNKLGQQDILFKAIAPFCEDITISVIDEFENTFKWIIQNGVFRGYESQKNMPTLKYKKRNNIIKKKFPYGKKNKKYITGYNRFVKDCYKIKKNIKVLVF